MVNIWGQTPKTYGRNPNYKPPQTYKPPTMGATPMPTSIPSMDSSPEDWRQTWLDSFIAPDTKGRILGDAQKRFGAVQKMNTNLAAGTQPFLGEQIMDSAEIQKQRMQMLAQLFSRMTPAGVQSEADRFRQNQMGSAMSQGQQIAALLQSQGASDSTQRGAILDQANRATSAANQNDLQQMSPERMAQFLAFAMQQQNLPLLQAFSALSSGAYGRPVNTEPKDSGMGGLLGGVAGALGGGLGGAIGSLFGGGGRQYEYQKDGPFIVGYK